MRWSIAVAVALAWALSPGCGTKDLDPSQYPDGWYLVGADAASTGAPDGGHPDGGGV